MKTKVLIAFLTLSIVMWGQAPSTAPKAKPKTATAAADCPCCKGMAKDHTCADCCKAGKCDMKDGASCPMMKDAKTACMGDKGCCAGMDHAGMNHAGMNHDAMKHDGANASKKPDMMSSDKMGAHCAMMAKDGKKDAKGCCGMCGSTGKTSGK